MGNRGPGVRDRPRLGRHCGVAIGRGRGLAVAAASVAAAIWLNLNGADAQVPNIPPPTDPGTVPTTVAPPGEAPAPTPPPTPAPAPPTDTLPPGTPQAPPTPASPAPAPAPTTTVPADQLSGSALPPARANGSPATAFGLDLSEIDALRRAARGKGPRAPEPDYGFDPTLRFRPGADAGTENVSEEPVELGAEDEEMARVRSAGAIAAGLMALLLLGIAQGLLRRASGPGTAGRTAPSPGGPGR